MKTRAKLGKPYFNRQKFYGNIITTPDKPFNVSLSFKYINDRAGTARITIVYWDDGKKKVIKDFMAGAATTSINFTINSPTSLPPFIVYLESDGVGYSDVEIDYAMPLNFSGLSENDEKILFEFNDRFELRRDLDLVYELQEKFFTASQIQSPLILDLDGDGVETISVEDGIYFDHDGNGFAEKTGCLI